jgi:hypothetical protein
VAAADCRPCDQDAVARAALFERLHEISTGSVRGRGNPQRQSRRAVHRGSPQKQSSEAVRRTCRIRPGIAPT